MAAQPPLKTTAVAKFIEKDHYLSQIRIQHKTTKIDKNKRNKAKKKKERIKASETKECLGGFFFSLFSPFFPKWIYDNEPLMDSYGFSSFQFCLKNNFL